MANLKQRLLDELAQGGFHHDTLRQLEKSCVEAFRGIQTSKVSAYDDVVLYVLGDFCYSVADYLDAIAPVTVELHSRIEQALADPLRGVIDCLGNQDPDASMKAFRDFVSAYQQLRAQS